MKTLYALFYFVFITFFVSSTGLEPNDIPIIPRLHNQRDSRKSYLAVCTMFKNEAEWLKEWIEYLRCVGVGHFYLYNNCSTDDYWAVLEPYVKKGIVELFDVPVDSTLYEISGIAHLTIQKTCFRHALEKAKENNTNHWLMMIDTDEFPLLEKGDDFREYLEGHISHAGLYIRWQIFGTSNVWSLKHKELLIEKLIYRAPSDDPGNLWGKSIVQPHLVMEVDGVHQVKFFEGTEGYYEPSIEECRIHHYFARTEEFLHTVKIPRLDKWRGYDIFQPETVINAAHAANSVFDQSMLRLVPKVKKRVFGHKKKK